MSDVSESGVLETYAVPLMMYMSLFLTLTHEVLVLLSFLLEMLPSVNSTMMHMVLVHVYEALSYNALANHVFHIVTLALSVLLLIFMHLLLLLQCG